MSVGSKGYHRDLARGGISAAQDGDGSTLTPPFHRWPALVPKVNAHATAVHDPMQWVPSSHAISTNLSQPRDRGQFHIAGGPHNAVVQLLDPTTKTPQFAIFLQANEVRTVEVPAGEWLIRIADGKTWQGPTRYFGFWTRYRLAKDHFEFSSTSGHALNLAETYSGNLPTTRQWFATPVK